MSLVSTILATIHGVGPGTPVRVDYDWEYFATAVPDHENLVEDPESASGSLDFLDDQGNGLPAPINVAVGEPGVLTASDSDNGSIDFDTSNPMSVFTIVASADLGHADGLARRRCVPGRSRRQRIHRPPHIPVVRRPRTSHRNPGRSIVRLDRLGASAR